MSRICAVRVDAWIAALLVSTAVGCDGTVIVQDTGGAGGQGGEPVEPVGAGGFGGFGGIAEVGGFGGLGGAGGDGGSGGVPTTGPVPGCEALEWVGEPVVIQGKHPAEAELVALDDGKIGLIYRARHATLARDIIASHVIDNAFEAWPPNVSPAAINLVEELHNNRGPVSARPDGTFALSSSGASGIYKVGQNDPLQHFDSFTWTLIEQAPGGGALTFEATFGDQSMTASIYRRGIDPAGSSKLVGEIPLDDLCGAFYGHSSATDPLVVFGSRHYCWDDVPNAHAVVFAGSSIAGLTKTADLPLPIFPRAQWVKPRLGGGYWYAGIDLSKGVAIYPITSGGQQDGPLIQLFKVGDAYVTGFAPWRDGFALPLRANKAVSLMVSNGVQITTNPIFVDGLSEQVDPAPVVAGGLDEKSIVVAFVGLDRITLARADCVSASD